MPRAVPGATCPREFAEPIAGGGGLLCKWGLTSSGRAATPVAPACGASGVNDRSEVRDKRVVLRAVPHLLINLEIMAPRYLQMQSFHSLPHCKNMFESTRLPPTFTHRQALALRPPLEPRRGVSGPGAEHDPGHATHKGVGLSTEYLAPQPPPRPSTGAAKSFQRGSHEQLSKRQRTKQWFPGRLLFTR